MKIRYIEDIGVLDVETPEREIEIWLKTAEQELIISVKGKRVVLKKSEGEKTHVLKINMKEVFAEGDLIVGSGVVKIVEEV